MAISGISSGNDFSNMSVSKTATTDNGSKMLQNQLANKEQSLNRLSSDSKLTAEEKAKERLELQKQIAELNRKLKLLEIEQKEEAKEAKKEQQQKAVLQEELQAENVVNDIQLKNSHANGTQNSQSGKQGNPDEIKEDDKVSQNSELAVLSTHDVQEMLIANSTLQKNRIQNQVVNQKESTEHILEAEIKMDKIYGNDNTFKQNELEAVQNKPAFEIEALNAPKQNTGVGISDKTKVIVVE